MAKKIATFEEQMEALKAITQSLESGQLTLDESLAQFEKGIQLFRTCESTLKEAERKVQLLLEDGKEVDWTDTEVIK